MVNFGVSNLGDRSIAKELSLFKGIIFDCVLAITAKENKIENI